MNDQAKTKKRLIEELQELRQQVAELQQSEKQRQRTEETSQKSPAISGNVSAQPADFPWPMFRGNRQHTGLSPYDTSHVVRYIKMEL